MAMNLAQILLAGGKPNVSTAVPSVAKKAPEASVVSAPESQPQVSAIQSYVAPEPLTNVAHKDGPANFRENLDAFDRILIATGGIDKLNLDEIRGRVRACMIDLKANPEYMDLVIDKDVHNIMKFMRESVKYAGESFTAKQVAKAKKETKKKIAAEIDFSALNLDIDLDELANLTTDHIKAKK